VGDAPPDWVREAARNAWGELRLFFATAVSFTRAPRQFVQRWCRGEGHALNPLGYLATSAGFVGAGAAALSAIPGAPSESGGLFAAALQSIGPYAHYFALALLCHAFLRPFGARAPLRGTLAVALYSGGGLAAALSLLLGLANTVMEATGHPGNIERLSQGYWLWWICVGLALLTLLAFAVPFAIAASAIQGVRIVAAAAALVLAMIASGFFFGAVDPPGYYGIHLRLSLRRAQGSWHFGAGLGL
jgi:hypothetical protein